LAKSAREIMEILEAFDLTRCAWSAAQLVGCDHKTVAHYVALRDAGADPTQPARRPREIDPFLAKVEELVERSAGKIRTRFGGSANRRPGGRRRVPNRRRRVRLPQRRPGDVAEELRVAGPCLGRQGRRGSGEVVQLHEDASRALPPIARWVAGWLVLQSHPGLVASPG
jgi:hypothetical protein